MPYARRPFYFGTVSLFISFLFNNGSPRPLGIASPNIQGRCMVRWDRMSIFITFCSLFYGSLLQAGSVILVCLEMACVLSFFFLSFIVYTTAYQPVNECDRC